MGKRDVEFLICLAGWNSRVGCSRSMENLMLCVFMMGVFVYDVC